MLFTIFTPTYNRAHLLPRLYQSLLNQTNQSFEWLIVDDGSTDHTEELIIQFIAERKLTIRYFKQVNQGKHIAVNYGLDRAQGKWFLTIDSDDYIAKDCIETCKLISEELLPGVNESCFTFIHATEKMDGNTSGFGKKRWGNSKEYDWEFEGEMIYVFLLQTAKKFKFPVFKDEKFCQESVMFLPLIRNHSVLYTDYILAFGEYLEDGLSQNHYKRMLQNPKYGMLSMAEKLKSATVRTDKIYIAKTYWDIAFKNPSISLWRKLNGISPFWTVYVLVQKSLRRFLK